MLTLGSQLNARAMETPRGHEAFSSTAVPMSIVAPGKTFRIAWDYPVTRETPDLVFNVYSTSDLSVPMRQWALRTTVPGSARSVQVLADNPQSYFVLTASNSSGESAYATR